MVLGTDGYTVLDVRKAADYETSHIPGAVSADMDAAVNGDTAAGEETMTTATEGLDDTSGRRLLLRQRLCSGHHQRPERHRL